MAIDDWNIKAEKCRKILKDSINQEWLLPEDKLPSKARLNVLGVAEESGALTAKELAITACDATALVQNMGSGEWTAEEVTIAFLKRATITHQLLNHATEFMSADAISQARALDAYFAKHGKLIGPLHGVPISTKEHVWHKGRIANGGYVALVDNVVPEDSHLVQLAKKAGAVFHLRTNEPQTLMAGEANNNIYGQTLNGNNLKLSPGGSSGGEGASISSHSAAIGLGTDIGGSIRIPAAFTGVYGFRPSATRMPYDGIELPGAGAESIRCVIGPLARSIDDIELMMKTTLDQKPWDVEVSLVPLPWRDVKSSKDITVGIMWSDGIVKPDPPMKRALQVAKSKLEAAGIKVVDWEPYKSEEALEIIVQSRLYPFDDHANHRQSTMFFPDAARTQLDLTEAAGEPLNADAAAALRRARLLSIREVWVYNDRRDRLRAEHHALMKSRGVDVIICPPYPGCAPLRNTVDWGSYTMLWNLFDLPALVFPTGLSVDAALDPVQVGYEPLNEFDKRQHEKYDPKIFDGAPLCLQLVGKHFQDEEVIAAGRVIVEIVNA